MKHTSPNYKLESIAIGECQWTKGFWADKFKICEESMVPYMGKLLCGSTGHALNNFKIAAGLKKGKHQGMFWHDGDFYKWIEAGLYVYAINRDKALLDQLNECIDIIAQAQEEDGYIQTQIQLRPEADRYENRKYHEMYNTGHLLTSACVHYQVTGERKFLEVAIKQADLLYTIFYPETKQFGRFGFNQTQIMGLVELYRITQNRKYLQLAESFINRRGTYEVKHHPTTEGYPIGDMVQERTPIREADEAVGHAVLALYYYAGAADVYAETGERSLLRALDRLWENVTHKKMYVTGAVGQTHYGASTSRDTIEEGFIDAYMMPNMTAYNETCANICNAMFSYRMLGIRGESKYADVMELVLYNSALSGIDIAGKNYFYANPLRMIHNSREYNAHENATETPNREPYLECFCCPPNLVRTIAKVSRWAYSKSKNGVAVNLYGGNKLETSLSDGSPLVITQQTLYPWEGQVQLNIKKCKSEAFDIRLRIPNWSEKTSITVNGEKIKRAVKRGKYTKLNREWKKGDQINIDFSMDVNLIEGHARIEEVRNQVAVKRGPIIYCVESPDLPKEASILDVYLSGKSSLQVEHRDDFLGGISTIQSTMLIRKDQTDELYQTVKQPEWHRQDTTMVPYFAWSNRGLAEMTVFLPIVWDLE